jgi:hypothetical protein
MLVPLRMVVRLRANKPHLSAEEIHDLCEDEMLSV